MERSIQVLEVGLAPEPARPSSRRAPRLDRRLAPRTADANPTHAPAKPAGKTRTTDDRATEVSARANPVAPIAPKTREMTVLVPRPEVGPRPVPAGHRTCPSPAHGGALVHQTIPFAMCEQRQCASYHKCASCTHRSQPQWSGRELPPPDNSPSAHARDRRSAQSNER